MAGNIIISDALIDRWQYGMNILARILSVSAALVVKNDPPGVEVLAASRLGETPYQKKERWRIAEKLYFTETVRTKKIVHVTHALKDPTWCQGPDVKRGMISCLVFPLMLPDGEVFGAVGLLDTKENEYGDMAFRLLELTKRLIEWDLEMLATTEKLFQEKEKLLAEADRSRRALLSILEDQHSAQQRLKRSLEEKETLLREIHHRVKNNLQLVISLLNLQMRRLDNAIAAQSLQRSQERIRAIAEVHEKLYQSESLARIDFSAYLRGLTRQLNIAYALPNLQIEIVTDVDDIKPSIDIAIPLGLIVNELVANALKYAFEGRTCGHIQISATENAGQIRVVVSDDGKGLPDSITVYEGGGLGFILIRSLVNQLRGTLSIDRGAGTTVTVAFPVA